MLKDTTILRAGAIAISLITSFGTGYCSNNGDVADFFSDSDFDNSKPDIFDNILNSEPVQRNESATNNYSPAVKDMIGRHQEDINKLISQFKEKERLSGEEKSALYAEIAQLKEKKAELKEQNKRQQMEINQLKTKIKELELDNDRLRSNK